MLRISTEKAAVSYIIEEKMMVGTALRRLRQIKNMTQDALARRMGVTRQAICMWEAERRELKASTLNKIARVLEVTPSQILDYQTVKTGKEAMKMANKKLDVNAKKKQVTFELKAPTAKTVLLAGDFNSWDKSGIMLKKSKGGVWKTTTTLAPGRYEYKFIVDGQWWTDPINPATTKNTYGSINSVMTITS